MDSLLRYIPSEAVASIDWEGLENGELRPILRAMAETQQNPDWHGEGDVLTHTKMVCGELIRLERWKRLPMRKRQALFIAALLHDIGKPSCTRIENGCLVSPHHAPTGAQMARTLLWQRFGLCGTADAMCFRETVCALIRYHTAPLHVLEHRTPELRMLQLASEGELIGDFSLEMLSCLAEADNRGRICKDIDKQMESLQLFEIAARDAGCFQSPVAFPSPFSRYAYLSGRNVVPGQALYDDTWGQVLLLSGLPGTGKDTFCHTEYPDLPLISLDDIRRDMRVAPDKPQGAVVQAANEQAKRYLRQKQPFVWNATNLSKVIRGRVTELLMRYGASVQIIYLETTWDEQLRRNQNRPHAVPEAVLQRMLETLVPPSVSEAQRVEWRCV